MAVKNYKKIFILLFIFISSLLCIFLYRHFNNKEEISLVNINELSNEFMDSYFEEMDSIDTEEEKENLLIVTSLNEIENTYGAVKVIEGPNNQYFLQYENESDKNNALNELEKDKSLISVSNNIVYTIDATSYNSWGISKMYLDSAIEAANSKTLNNIVVAIIDTGCNMTTFYSNYTNKISETYNALTSSTTSMSDTHGHGTHIAGTIAEGTPKNVKIMPVKVSTSGTMYDSDIIKAINYIVNNKKANVINMSFGGYDEDTALSTAIASANNNNIICVAAAGNDNVSTTHYPSALSTTISVASVDSSLNKSSFSNYGSTITFTAPGTSILSINGTYSGTSMATPHVSAAVAILKSYNKDLNLTQTINLLKRNAIDLGSKGWDQYYGYGFVSFKDAVFCDDTVCDAYGVFKKDDKDIKTLNSIETVFTKYNYYSITNLLASIINVTYTDNTTQDLLLTDLPNIEILNYDPYSTENQTITIKSNSLSLNISITNPTNYEIGWEYEIVNTNQIEITGYKSHDLKIKQLYIPETIELMNVVSFKDNITFNDISDDFNRYVYLYLSSNFNTIGSYNFKNSSIKYVNGSNDIKVNDYSFDSSDIIEFNIPIINVGNSSFINCSNLNSISIINGEINSKAFYNSGLEKIYIGSNVTLISEDAFAYSNLKESINSNDGSGIYNAINDIGIVDLINNVLIVGFSNNIPSYITELGDYAYTGNNTLNNIVIPSTITKIGDYTFKDTTNLSNVYLLNKDISISNNTFDNTSSYVYVYKESNAKTVLKNNSVNYRHIDPDDIVILNYQNSYETLSSVDTDTIIVKLIYNEESTREEVLSIINNDSNGIGYTIKYIDDRDKFNYGDTYFTIYTKNSLGYEMSKNISVNITKIIPTYSVPTNLVGKYYRKLSSVTLPDGFSWIDNDTLLNSLGYNTYKAKYTPEDTSNYEIVNDIDITIGVIETRELIEPNITISDKSYDGTNEIPLSNISISNLESNEYEIISATSSNINPGESIATIKIKLSNDMFLAYYFDGFLQEKEFNVDFNIIKSSMNYTSKNIETFYDEKDHSLDIDVNNTNYVIKYSLDNINFDLDESPNYKDIGEYTVYYKITSNGYEDIYGSNVINIYGIKSISETIKDNIILIKNNSFNILKEKFNIFSITNSKFHLDKNDELIDNDSIKTGDKIKININDIKDYIYLIAYLGDINSDGKISSADYVKIRKHIMETEIIKDKEYFLASDINGDNKISSADYVRIKKYIMNGEEL